MVPNTSTTVPRDVFRALFRHKKKAMLCFVLILAGTAATVCLLPRKYHSEGKFLLRLGRENSMLDSTATMAQDPVVVVPQSRDSELNSVVEILRSRAVAEKVVDALGPAFILDKKPSAETSAEDSPDDWATTARQRGVAAIATARAWWRSLQGTSDLDDRDRAVVVLLKSCTVTALRKSNLIQIDCRGPSPRWTQAVVGKLIELYQEEHIRLNRPEGSLKFFAEQTARCQRDLARNENDLRDLKTATGLASPPEQRQALVARIGRLQDDLLQVEAARTVSLTRVQAMRPQLAVIPAQHVTSRQEGIGHQATDFMRHELYALEVKKEAVAAAYTEAHPAMQRVQEQLDAARGIVDGQEPTRTHVTTGVNRVHEEVRLALTIEEPILASLEAKAGTLRGQLARVSGELKSLNDNELQIAKLQREVELQQATYRKYAANLEQARIDQALETQRMSNISVAQPATLEPLAVSPRKAALLAIGVLAGLLGAFATAMIASWRDHTFHTPAELQRGLEVQVLGSVPRVMPKEMSLAGNGKH